MQLNQSAIQLPGVPLALGSAILFGAATPLSKLLLASVGPQTLAGLLYIGAGLGLAAVHTVRTALGLANPEAPLRRHDLPWLIVIVIFGGILGPMLLMFGLGRTPATSGSLLQNLESLATMGIAWLVFRENVDRRLVLGALAIILGAIILSWEGQRFSLDVGAALIAGACVCWGIDNNLTRKLSSADPVTIAMIKGLFAGAANMAGGLWCLAIGWYRSAICPARILRDRGQPCSFRAGPSSSRDRSYGCLLLIGSVYWRDDRFRPGRADDVQAGFRGTADGAGALAASHRTT